MDYGRMDMVNGNYMEENNRRMAEEEQRRKAEEERRRAEELRICLLYTSPSPRD